MKYGHHIRVVHIIEGFVGGLSTYLCTVLPELAQKGADVTLICSLNRSSPSGHTEISRLRKSGVKVHVLPMAREINLLKDTRSFLSIIRLLRINNYNIVHTHCSKAGVLGRIAALIAGKKARLHTPHCFAFLREGNSLGRKVYFAIEKLMGKLTTKLVAVSYSEASVATDTKIVSRQKCVVLGNFLDSCCKTLNYQPQEKLSLKEKLIPKCDESVRIVTTACRLVDYKGIFRFLRAVQISQAKNVVFAIAGEGPLEYPIAQFIKHNKLENKVKLVGHLSNMDELYAISDIFCLCSDAEGQPYVLLEAMKAKCPIVATSVIGNKDLITNNKNGVLTDLNPSHIAAVIDNLLADKNRRLRLAGNAHTYFLENHILEKKIDALIDIYKSCLSAG